MTFTNYFEEPELRSPVLVAAFGGWNDAADAATTTIKFLVDTWKPKKIAEIDGEEFFVFTETRPVVQFSKGSLRSLTWPSNQFFAYVDPRQEHDFILYLGSEPQLKWKTFTREFVDVCKHFHVEEALLLGAFLASIPHSLTVPMSGFSSNAELTERLNELDIHGSRYEGPTGMVGVLQDVFQQAKIPVASIWAAAPHYLAATPNIKVTAALLTYLNTYLTLDLNLSDIQADAVRFEEQITALVNRDPEASSYVHKLEEQASHLLEDDDEDEEEGDEDEYENGIMMHPDRPTSTSGPLPSADSLIRSVEELLRKEREHNRKNDSDDEGNA